MRNTVCSVFHFVEKTLRAKDDGSWQTVDNISLSGYFQNDCYAIVTLSECGAKATATFWPTGKL